MIWGNKALLIVGDTQQLKQRSSVIGTCGEKETEHKKGHMNLKLSKH